MNLNLSKEEQLLFLSRYGFNNIKDWEDVVIKTLYKNTKEVVPCWIDWLIKRTGYGYFLLNLIGVKTFCFRDGDDYRILIETKSSKFECCGGIYVK